MKALLVVGSAPRALADLAAAKRLYPDAEVMLVNGACTMVEAAQHMVAGHTVKANQFVAARDKAFPLAGPIRVHANTLVKHRRDYEIAYPVVTDWWGPEMSSGATSAGKAALIGLAMGFGPVVLCGCPMDGSGYDLNEAVVPHDRACARVGHAAAQGKRMVLSYQEKMASLAATVFKGKVFSMSGYTREHLGSPPAWGQQMDWLS